MPLSSKTHTLPWLGGSSGWSIVLYTKTLQVPILAGHVPSLQVPSPVRECTGSKQSMFLSLSLSSSINISPGKDLKNPTDFYHIENRIHSPNLGWLLHLTAPHSPPPGWPPSIPSLPRSVLREARSGHLYPKEPPTLSSLLLSLYPLVVLCLLHGACLARSDISAYFLLSFSSVRIRAPETRETVCLFPSVGTVLRPEPCSV